MIAPGDRLLGKLPAKSDPRALMLARFVEMPKALPARTHFWPRRKSFPIRSFGNTEYGDCTRASQAILAMRMERLETRRTPSISDEEIIRVYKEMTTRLYGADWENDPWGADTGAFEVDALSAWRRPDETFRDTKGRPLTIDAYLRINHADHRALKEALVTAGAHGIKVCLNLPAAYINVLPPADWDIPAGQPLIGEWQPGSWGGHCAAGDTPIPLLNGQTIPLKDLVGESDIWVYGALPNSQPIPAKAQTAIRSRKAQTYRLITDIGVPIRLTAEHLVMMRDGTYRPVSALFEGARLMPLRRLIHHRGYEKVKWYDGAKHQAFTHRLVAEAMGCRPDQVSHHRDGNKRNNHPSNFEFGSQSDHIKHHRPWEFSSLTYAPGWFSTEAGREYLRNRSKAVPASENHKVVAVEPCGTEWVYDLIGVSPTANFAAGSIFIHNSMSAVDYDEKGIWMPHQWNISDQRITWAAAAAYLDEAHVVIDSLDSWRKRGDIPKKVAEKIASAVNDVSDTKIAA